MIKIKIITVNGIYKEDSADILNVVTTDGQRGILARHMPLVTMLEISKLSYRKNEQKYDFAISGGMLYFANDVATILVNTIESAEEINLERAKSALERAQKRINDQKYDRIRAEVALKKAINRINVKQN